MRCEHDHDDAAYVLGALPPAEREAYERHLETCATCRTSVADVAGMPGLLARLDPTSARAMLAGAMPGDRPTRAGIATGTGDAVAAVTTPPPPAPETLLPRILRAAATEQRRNQRRARWRTVAGAAVAACLALVIGAGSALALREDPPPTVTLPPPKVAMVPVSSSSQVGANLSLVDHPWGTEVRMWCKYKGASSPAPDGGYPRRYHYQLVAITKDDTTALLASWAVEAGGKEPEVTATTEYRRDQLQRLELRRADGTPLLLYNL